MTIRISGKSISIGDALRTRVDDRIAEAMEKYFGGAYSGHVTIGKERNGFRTECALHLDSGIILEADAVDGDAYASADHAIARIEKRLRRYKSRIKDRHTRKVSAAAQDQNALSVPSYVIEAPSHEADDDVAEFNPVIIAEATTSLPKLSVSEAVMELDLTGAPVLVFRHGSNGRVNVIYRRTDGNIGWVDTPAANA